MSWQNSFHSECQAYHKSGYFFCRLTDQILSPQLDCPNSPTKMNPPMKKIGVMQISKVLSEVYGSSSASNSQDSIPLQQKLIVCTLLLMVKQGKLKEVTLGKVSMIRIKHWDVWILMPLSVILWHFPRDRKCTVLFMRPSGVIEILLSRKESYKSLFYNHVFVYSP